MRDNKYHWKIVLSLLLFIFFITSCATKIEEADESVKVVEPLIESHQTGGLFTIIEPEGLLEEREALFSEIESSFKEIVEEVEHDKNSLKGILSEPSIQKTPAPHLKEDKVVVAIGSGLTELAARSDALAALSTILHSQVKSSIEVSELNLKIGDEIVDATSAYREDIIVSTNLPILGASYTPLSSYYDSQRDVRIYQVEAALMASTSLPLYEKELKAVALSINESVEDIEIGVDSLREEEEILLLLSYYEQFQKLSYVAQVFGATELPRLNRSRYTLEALLLELESINDSYEKTARNLTKTFDQGGVYVYPAKLNGSGGVTEFAEQLAYNMVNNLGSQAVNDPLRATHYLFGSYTLIEDGKKGIYVSYRLEDKVGNVVATSAAQLLPIVYEGQRFIPVAYDFQKQLERGEAVDSSFQIDIRINGKKDYLSFHKYDELVIEARATAPCYFYVVGYVFYDNDERLSYLFPLKLDAVGKDIFVHHVSPEDVNKWIIINPTYRGIVVPIEIIEPYGVEMLQIYASTESNYQKFLERVPNFTTTRDYYLISEDPEEGLELTRALNIKNIADQVAREVVNSEAFVSFKSGK